MARETIRTSPETAKTTKGAHMRKLQTTFLLIVLLLAGMVPASRGEIRTLTILQTTDIHGAMGDAKAPGLLQVATLAEEIRHDLWIDCGDLTQGSYQASMDRGESMIKAMNAAGCDVWVPGNHDFDYGVDVIAGRTAKFKGTVLAANMKSKTPMKTASWKLFERQGVKIAVIGIVPPYLGLWIEPKLLAGLKLEPPEDALTRVMPAVMAEKPDVIVLAIHLGEFIAGRLNPDGKLRSMASLASKFPQIDLILAGHSHETVPGKRLYPGAWFVQCPPHGTGVAVVKIEVDPAAKKDKVKEIRSNIRETEGAAESAKVLPVLNPVRKRAAEEGKKIVAKLEFELGPIQNAKKPNRLAELFGLAMMEATGAKAAFAGTLSNYKVSPGTLNERELYLLAPYEDELEVRLFTPAQIRIVLRELETKEKTADWMPCTGIVAPDGIDGALVLGRTGKPIAEGTKIAVAFNAYDAHGAGGRYPELKKLAESLPEAPGAPHIDLRSAFRAYMKKHYPANPKPTSRKP